MSIVNTETGEIVEPMSADEARRLTERIRIAASNYTEAKAKVLALVDEAKAGRADFALGYKSWTAYLADVLSDEPLRLARDERREFAAHLANEGMSTRAIAPILGVDQKTVSNDLRSGEEISSPEPEFVSSTEALAEITQTPVVAEEGEAEATTGPAPVVGIDGKTYSRPAPTTRKKQPQQVTTLEGVIELLRVPTRHSLPSITELDEAITSEEAARLMGDLSKTRSELSRVINLLKERTA